MSTLFVMFDTKTGRFLGSSLAGKFLYGVAEVHLTKDRLSVLDYEGRDLLAAPAKTDESSAAADIAQAFGVGTTPTDDEPVDVFDLWGWSVRA
jgi:hypothetical protein